MRKILLLLPAIILLLTTISIANDEQIFAPHSQRSEIRYPGFYTVLHTCAVDGDRVVVFSRGEHLVGGEHQYLGIFAHTVKPNKNRGTKPRLHFKGEGGSWGANDLDSVWPGDRQDSKKKFGLLFAALTPDYDGTPAKFVVSPFNRIGRTAGDQYVIHEIEESADNAQWVDTAWIAAEIGLESIGVTFSYVLRTYNNATSTFDYQTRAYFLEFDFLGQPISDLQQIPLTSRDGLDVIARVFRPASINGRWVIPITSRSIRDGEVLQDQLRTATVLKNKIKNRTIDYANVRNIKPYDDFVFSDAQYLEPWLGPDSTGPVRTLMVQRRDFSPKVKPDVRRYDTSYALYDISDYGKMIGKANNLKLDQWIPKLEAEGRAISLYNETMTMAQPVARNTYLFVVTREAELMTQDKYQFTELEGDMAVYSFTLSNKKIMTEFDDLAFDEYFMRVGGGARRQLLRLPDSGSLVMPSGCVEQGYSQDRRSWLNLFHFDVIGKPARPAARTDHVMAYSPHSGMSLMFGGAGKDGLLNDLWQWDGYLWHEVNDGIAPDKRSRSAMVYDEARKRFVMFGGHGSSGELGDTWLWDGTQWAEFAGSGPDARQGNAMAYCSTRKVTYSFGGRSGSAYFDDLWQWDGSKWTELTTTYAPSPRSESTIAWDPDRKRLILAGGIDADGGIADTWEFNPANGNWVQTVGNEPYPSIGPLGGATAVYHAADKALYLFGGYWWDPESNYQDVERMLKRYVPGGSSTWNNEYPPTWIPARTGHAAVYDSVHKQIIIFGGWDDGDLMADTWTWNGSDWLNIMP